MAPIVKPTSSPDRQGATETQRHPMAKPLHPYIVMLVAAVLPGVGQVLNNTPVRGLTMIFFMILLGIITFHLTTPSQSFVGRYAGGFFIYSISVMDAYKWARYRWEYYRRRSGEEQKNGGTP